MSFPTLNALQMLNKQIVYNPAIKNQLEVLEDGVSIISDRLGVGRPYHSNVPARPSPGKNPKLGAGVPHRRPDPPRIRPPPSLMPIHSVENM